MAFKYDIAPGPDIIDAPNVQIYTYIHPTDDIGFTEKQSTEPNQEEDTKLQELRPVGKRMTGTISTLYYTHILVIITYFQNHGVDTQALNGIQKS